jgi:hypothetical protein
VRERRKALEADILPRHIEWVTVLVVKWAPAPPALGGQLAQGLDFGHSPVAAHHGDQFVGAPRVRGHELIRFQREHAVVRGFVRSPQSREHETEVKLRGRYPAALAARCSAGRSVPGIILRRRVPQPRQCGARIKRQLVAIKEEMMIRWALR